MGGPTGWWTHDTSPRPDDAPPSSDPASSWSHIVEETPDPHGPFWVTTEQAEKLVPRIESAEKVGKVDPFLLEILRGLTGQ